MSTTPQSDTPLREQLDSADIALRDAMDTITGLRRELAEANIKVALAREDTARLDWLSAMLRNMDSIRGGTWLRIGDNGRLQIFGHQIPHHVTHLVWHDEFCVLDSIVSAGTNDVRTAIDNARAEAAEMHAAAVGEIRGPTVGPVEDIAALRVENVAAEKTN